MGKRSQRRRVRLEKDQAGCMWGLISIFDFRHARFTRKLLLDRKRGSRHPVGAGYPRTKLKMLTYYDEKYQNTEDLEENELATTDALKTSVKELMEKEMFSEQGLRKNMSNAGVQLNQSTSENGGHVREKPTQAKENRSKSCDMHIIDLDGAENSSHQVLDQETSNKLDMEIILEELCRLNQKGSCLKHDLHDDVNMESNQVHSAVEEKLGTAIKVFISQRFSNDKHLTENGKTHHSKEFMDALRMLSSNKELFFELLQDPNSLLVKHIQSMEDAQLDKDQNNCSLSRSNLLEEEPSKPRSDELTNRKHRSFFRRRSKSHDSNSLKDTNKLTPSSRIVILKPGRSTSLKNSGIGSIGSTSVESSHSMDNKPQSERNTSQFSLHEIKRKLKHAMGKERHGISLVHEKGVGEGNGGWGSPNRNHFYTERFAKSPVGTKRGDKIGKSKESETILMNETVENPKQVVSKIYIEAKKHLSEMLSNGVEKEELMGRPLPKTLGRILSLPEYSFTPLGSPGKDREHNFVTAQMRLSPCSNFHMVNENKWRIIQENHAIQLSSPKQNLESQSCITDYKSVEKEQSLNSNPDVSCELNHDNSVEETTSMREENACEELPESVRNSNPEFQDDIQVSDGESSIPLFNREIQSCDAAEIYDDEGSLKRVKLDSIEKDELLSSPPVSPSPPSPSITRKVETPDTSTDRADGPSPISVLEPLFSEDDISPSSTKTKPVATAIQPLQIHFEEPVSCDADQAICTITCMDDEESSFEYVEAVLLGSGLNWDEYLLRWLSLDELLDPSLIDEVELFSSRSSHDQMLLFDCTNEVLTEVCKRYFGRSFVKQAIRLVPKGMKLISEVWEGVEWHILQHRAPHSLDQLLRNDMSKSGTWMDLHFETDHIVIELEKSILEELVEDTILISDNNSIKDKFSTLPDEMIENEEEPINI